MHNIKPAHNQPDDRFGYSCYSLVLIAPEDIIAKANDIKRNSGMTVAHLPAHITIKGTFYGIESLDHLKQTICSITDNTKPFYVGLKEAKLHWSDKGGGLTIPVTSEMQELHDALVAAVSPLATAAYHDDPYRAHMNFVYDSTPEGLEHAKKQAAQTDFGDGFLAKFVDLVGRQGKAYGGEWKLIDRIPLAKQDK